MIRDADLLSVQEARELVEKAWEASRKFAVYSQDRVDAVIDAMAQAATRAAEVLAREAVEETGYGVVADKVEKNLLCSRDLYARIRPMKTVGVLREDREARIVEVAVPVGVVAAVLPTTNPTSTAIYKTLIALKARNAIVLSPHPNAVRCTCHTAQVLSEAALAAGAPEHVVGCLTRPSAAGTQELMKHRRTAAILSTGGPGIVRAAYSSGKPAFGVGPGNVPALIERSADVPKAVADVVRGTTFDNGTLCSSEQALVAEDAVREQVMAELARQHAYILNETESEKLGRVLVTPNWTVNPKCVGKPAVTVAGLAGIAVPPETRVLIAPLKGVGKEHPLSAEKLSPVLALYFVKDFDEGCQVCESILRFGGLGHTCVIHSRDDARIREYGFRMPAFRVVVNSPAPHGSVGYSTGLFPSMTLGCGALGGNITGDNITPLHLINTKRIAWELRPVTEQQPRRMPPAAAVSARAAAATAVGAPAAAGASSRPSPPAAPASGAPVTIDRDTIARVVERFLATRGAPSAPPATASVNAGPAGPRAAGASAPPPEGENTQPAGGQSKSADQSCGAAPPASDPASGSSPKVVDFVCENDVRMAVSRNQKIHIGPRTIITPSARELAADKAVLVMISGPSAPGGPG